MASALIASALFDSLLASGGGSGTAAPPPKISETTGRITMKFLPDIKLIEEAQNQNEFDIT